MKIVKLFPLLLISFVLSLSSSHVGVFANSNMEEIEEFNDRKVPQTLHIKYDYEDLYKFLEISEKEYKAEWKSGKTISEMAETRDIAPQHLILYLAEKHFAALDEALKKGEIDEYFYYDYAISYMKSNILEFINRNPNK